MNDEVTLPFVLDRLFDEEALLLFEVVKVRVLEPLLLTNDEGEAVVFFFVVLLMLLLVLQRLVVVLLVRFVTMSNRPKSPIPS